MQINKQHIQYLPLTIYIYISKEITKKPVKFKMLVIETEKTKSCNLPRLKEMLVKLCILGHAFHNLNLPFSTELPQHLRLSYQINDYQNLDHISQNLRNKNDSISCAIIIFNRPRLICHGKVTLCQR